MTTTGRLVRATLLAVLLTAGCGEGGDPAASEPTEASSSTSTQTGASQGASTGGSGGGGLGGGGAGASGGAAREGKVVLLHDFIAGPAPTPSFIHDNLAYLETTPFDGAAVYARDPDATTNVSSSVLSSQPLAYDTILNVLSPLKDLPATTFRHHAVIVFNDRPADLFDDWSVPIANFENLARAIKDTGLAGVYFDNEQYAGHWGNWPDDCSQPKSLAEYQDQARLRGKQIMQAMVGVFPDIVVLTLHGPYISEPEAPVPPFFGPVDFANELLGPFFAGFAEGKGTAAKVIDGGEIYHLRTQDEFDQTYQFRKYDIAADAVDCAFIPPPLRAVWPQTVGIAYGLYDMPSAGQPMDPTILEPTMTHALGRTDRYVWMYTESITFLVPPDQGGAGQDWLDAIAGAKMAAGN